MTAITSKTFTEVPVLNIPRGARVAAEVFLAASRLVARLLTTSPAPKARRRNGEAEAVRALARRWERTDPGFAADLHAAAARHDNEADLH